MMQTFADLMDHVLAYSGDDATPGATMRHRLAVQNAYRALPTRHDWQYLWALGRVQTNGVVGTSIDASTVTYTYATNTLTLSGATWPTWAADGYVVIENVPYGVLARTGSTTLTLEAATRPAADIAAGTIYTLLRDQYPTPSDLVAIDEVTVNEVGAVLEWMHPRNWSSQRRVQSGPGQPWMFSLIGNKDVIGGMKMVLWPPPDGVYNIDFLYRRRPRPLTYMAESDGVVSGTASTITGTGTNFAAGMVGSVIRLGADATTVPTGDTGNAPAQVERTITAVASATSLTVDSDLDAAATGVKYAISDPIDVDYSVMWEYLLREVESQFRRISRMKPVEGIIEERVYSLALQQAMEADGRNTGRQAALRTQTRRSGFIHYPINFSGG